MKLEILPIVAMFISFFSCMTVSEAAGENKGLYRVTCPPRYPGPEKQGAKLTYQRGWYEVGSPFGPPETVQVYLYPTSIFIDCGYGYPVGQPLREDLTPYRVIVAVPGRAFHCDGPNDGRSPFWCDTAPEEDGTIGPVKLYISERISLSTTLKGFGIGRSREEIAARADALGLACTGHDEAGGKSVSVCVGSAGEGVTIRFANGRSQVVEWRRLADQPGRYKQFYEETVLRFGLDLWTVNVPTWMEKGGTAKLEETGAKGEFTLTLTDLTVPAPR